MSYEFKRTHYGSLHGIPCWIDLTDDEAPAIRAKGGLIGECALDVMDFLFGCYCTVACLLNPDFEPMFAIKIKGAANAT